MFTAPRGFNCRNVSYADAQCGDALDRDGDHGVICPTGPWRSFRHTSLCDEYAGIFDEVGAYVRREAYVEEMSREYDAILDAWAGTAELPDLLADVTVRHPTCSHYMPAASAITGYAADHAEREKMRKHPPSQGHRIIPFAHENSGRLGPQAEDLMSRCAAVATRPAHRQGRLPPRVLRKWRARLDATLAPGIAMQLHVCFNGTLAPRLFARIAACNQPPIEARCPLP
jgi:hypothetical protein